MCKKKSGSKCQCCVGATADAEFNHLPPIRRCKRREKKEGKGKKVLVLLGENFELVNSKTHQNTVLHQLDILVHKGLIQLSSSSPFFTNIRFFSWWE